MRVRDARRAHEAFAALATKSDDAKLAAAHISDKLHATDAYAVRGLAKRFLFACLPGELCRTLALSM